MKQHMLVASTGRFSLMAAASVIALAGTSAFAQDAVQKGRLGGVTVTDTAIDTPEAETGYKVTNSVSAMRTDTPLVDTPQAVNVVTIKQIEDQSANSIGDAIRYVPGVFSAQGEGNRETILFRGNSATGDFFVDGVRDDVQTYRDLYNIEELQVFRGSNAMIFGRGGIGGVINRVTKVADWTPHQAIRVEGGMYKHARGSFDLGTPINDAVAVRLTGVVQSSGSYRWDVDYKRWGFNPTVAFKISPDTLLTLGYEHFKDERVADRGVSSYLGKPLDVDSGTFFGNARQSPTSTNTDAVSMALEHRFSDAVVIRNHTRYAHYEKYYANVFAGAVNTAQRVVTTAASGPGLAPGTYAPGTIVAISAYDTATVRKNFISQTDLNIDLDTGGIKHTILAGFEYGRQITDNLGFDGLFSSTGFTGQTTVYAPISNPVVNFGLDLGTRFRSSNHGTATVVAGYVQDQIELAPMVQIVAGIRYENFKTNVQDRRPSSPSFVSVTNNLWSPRAALIFKPVQNASIYAGYSRTYQPRGGDQLAGLTPTNASLVPEKFQNYEIGAKWDVNARFNAQVAVFQLDRNNVLALSNPNDPTSLSVPIGRQRTKGVEVSIAGNLTDQLSMVGAYTYSDASFLDSQSGTVKAGNKVPNVPEHAASLWTRYDPVKAFGIAVGVIHQGKRFAATDNLVSLDAYTRVDGALYYTVNPNVAFQLNVENLFSEKYALFAHSNTNITPGSPTAVKAGFTAKF